MIRSMVVQEGVSEAVRTSATAMGFTFPLEGCEPELKAEIGLGLDAENWGWHPRGVGGVVVVKMGGGTGWGLGVFGEDDHAVGFKGGPGAGEELFGRDDAAPGWDRSLVGTQEGEHGR